jgi:hypothetical protein
MALVSRKKGKKMQKTRRALGRPGLRTVFEVSQAARMDAPHDSFRMGIDMEMSQSANMAAS